VSSLIIPVLKQKQENVQINMTNELGSDMFFLSQWSIGSELLNGLMVIHFTNQPNLRFKTGPTPHNYIHTSVKVVWVGVNQQRKKLHRDHLNLVGDQNKFHCE
jgi:hypothetical protein